MTARLLRLLTSLGCALLVGGCSSIDTNLTDRGPVYKPTNTRGPAVWPANLRRVAILPLHDTSGRLPASFVTSHDAIWRRTLDRSQRTEFVGLTRTQLTLWSRHETLASTDLIPPDLLPRIARETDAQAVLFLDLNHCSPYPPLALSIRARLVDLSTGETVWMADELFDSGTDATARAARHYAKANASGLGDTTSGILQSPTRFAEYAFQAVAELLPPHTAPAATSHR
jgi:hypothetical protein